MGISDVVDNLRSLKKTVKKPINAFRETVHNAYTKAYVGSPERVDEFYNYIKVYTPSKHNDLCMMSITADINRFSMIPDKNTFFHVLKLERHFDRMIATRGTSGDVTGDMAIEILSGHNASFMSKYRRYKTRSAAKDLKRRNQRVKALNVRRHCQLPESKTDDSCIYSNRSSYDMPILNVGDETLLPQADPLPQTSQSAKPVVEKNPPVILKKSAELEEIPHKKEDKKNITVMCELTKPETVVAAPTPVQNVVVAPAKEDDSLAISAAKANLIQKKHHVKSSTEKSMMSTVTKHDAKFKVAKSVPVKKEKMEKAEGFTHQKPLEAKKTVEVLDDDEDDDEVEEALAEIVKNLNLAGTPAAKAIVQPKIVVEQESDSESQDEFDKCDSDDSDDGSDIEELEKIEDKDVDALEYEMI
ncbi:Protein CBG08598 [Caenorhabditis briggsae]|uniref:Uncharacterized protein n=2 Tax=Caenorhabditis briggsae TaxID=6238 RepID=A0AAE9A0S0_CAEBR|nr:Protein CBG08598 [Caenorhabditis briggsae]ULT88550.1 hypothetical protein L3Y34_007630 [Caenorhabditis briggsae]CAP28423.2 Protein CBG08598 [Caenorhabditis briggsae]